ncbi:hypothetical protein MARPO_0106s0048 [Marchantia polymorpha]|uniref:C3H1-type domain-containing protein n=1 Tax=Marchantia polymorpha TaxID=3197 RepID=A0A2R6WDD0_MARPO|nr:hypothetical protein MARPO_0106s0048 [Marchantia polymorpha]|eukprot:PTQ31863.1 hypothetical protein MARPO_0106s0048 [Marchantia polymorpha]
MGRVYGVSDINARLAAEARRYGSSEQMDPYEAYRVVCARVQNLDPENVSKIMGYLLLQDHGDEEMFRLAMGSDGLIQNMVVKARKELAQLNRPPSAQQNSVQLTSQLAHHSLQSSLLQQTLSHISAQQSPNQLSSISHVQPEQDHRRPTPLYIPDSHPYLNFSISPMQEQVPLHEKLASLHDKLPSYHDQLLYHDQLPIHDQSLFNDSPDAQSSQIRIFPNEHFYPETFAFLNSSTKLSAAADHLYSRSSSRRNSPIVDSSSPPDIGPALAWKPCLYFARGFCKHGSNCRFLHGPVRENSGSSSTSSGQREMRGEEGIASGSLERLEMELQELLRGRRAPVSIASLPQLYYERFGKTLQAEGYLTESQRHGKAGYSLTKLLARLKNTVTLIDRPHGQHAVVLAEDAHRFTAFRGERDDLSGVNPSSRQIYLTFPAESSFTEEDVTSHFRAYGPVQDVRIPYQQKRMFGFVTFVYSETVKAILSEGNPHYICGARVLVKPYREKGKHGDRKYSERGDHPRYQQSRSLESKDYDYQHPPTPKYFDDDETFTRRLEEEEQQVLDLDRRRLVDLQQLQHLDVQRRRAQQQAQAQAEAEANLQAVAQAHVQAQAQAQAQVQAQQGISNGGYISEELNLNSEDMPHFHSDNSFGYLLDVLDGENGDDGDPNETFGGMQQGGHNLPDSPFTSPHGTNKQKAAFSLPEKMKSLNLGGQTSSWSQYHHGSPTLFASNVF